MEPAFWHQRWETNEIGFHESKPNPQLVAYFNALSVAKGSRIFVPLCGKTLAIGWLLSQGYRVAGAELSELAITQLFAELGIDAAITEFGTIKWYSATGIDIFAGDIFDLTRELLGPVDAVFDRAALIALPEPMRVRYTKHLIDLTRIDLTRINLTRINLTRNAPQLLLTFDYDQTLMQGPPFAVSGDEVRRHYEDSYEIVALATLDLMAGRTGAIAAKENVWLLKNS